MDRLRLLVTDNQTGCTTEVNLFLTENTAEANVDLAPLELACFDGTNGTIAYTIDYDPGFVYPSTETIVNEFGAPVENGDLSIGSYCIIITDANGCVAGGTCFRCDCSGCI